MFNTEIVAKDIDGIKMQLRKAYDGDAPEGLAVFYWLKNNGIGIRDRNGEIVRDEDLYSFCINYGASVDRAIVAAKGEGAGNEYAKSGNNKHYLELSRAIQHKNII